MIIDFLKQFVMGLSEYQESFGAYFDAYFNSVLESIALARTLLILNDTDISVM